MSNTASSGSRRGGRRGNLSQEAEAGGSGAGDRPPAAAAAAAATVEASRKDEDPDDLGGEGSNNGSTTTEGGGGSADEPGSRKAKRRRLGGNTQPQKSVHPTQADSDRWFTNTHIAMVVILAELFTELQERHLKSHDEDKEEEEAVLGYMQRIKDIGQEANAFTKSRVQTHLLISNTVQLCHRMAGDKYCKLAKDYPPGDTSDFDYDFTTDAESDEEDYEDEDDPLWGSSRGGGASAGGSAKRGDSGGASSNGNNGRVSNGKAKKREGGGRGPMGVSDEQRRGSVRERFESVVLSLTERARWNVERSGKPRKSVITRGREVVMAIFIDSYYRRMLSREILNEALGNLERIVAWADRAGEASGSMDSEMDLGDGLPLSKVGLANIALTPPE